jgi:excisionase family DNA binding protein
MGAYLSARESADYCGVSEKTIRNWIAAGRLSAEKSAGAFRIAQEDLDAFRTAGPHRPRMRSPLSAEVRADAPAVVELVAMVRALQEQLIARTEAAAMWQERAGALSDRLALAESRLDALMAPQQPQEPTLDASTASQGPGPSPEPSRPWWRSPWLYGVVGLLALLLAAGGWLIW